MEKSSSLLLQQEWNKLMDKLQIHLKQMQYHLMYVELKLAAAILQQEVSSELLATLSKATISLIKNCLIAVGQAADEKDYRDQFHKTLLAQWHKILSDKHAGLAKTFLEKIRYKVPSSIMVKTKYHFSHDFNVLYTTNNSVNPYQTLKSEQESRLTRLEGSFERNRYAVYAEIIVTYVRCLIRSRQTFAAKHLVALGTFLESLIYIAVTQQTGHEELWHYLLPLQIDLADELIYTHHQLYLESAQLLAWQQRQPHKTGESLLLLQTVAHTLNLNKNLSESALINWLQTVHTFIDSLNTYDPQTVTCELLQTEQHQQTLAEHRKFFSKSNVNFIELQKNFSMNSLKLLQDMTNQMSQLLGEKPCKWALCATGSSARLDRRPYSDVELMLLYQAKTNISASHMQTYLYFLLSGLEIAIKQLGETHYEYICSEKNNHDVAGFHLDSSCHILREELFNTPQNIVAQYFLKTLSRKQAPDEASEDWHDWLHNRKFYALLFPKLIIGNEDLLTLYFTELKQFLAAEVSALDQLDRLAQVLTWPSLVTVKLPRHQVIALSCLAQVLQESQQQLATLKADAMVNLKDTFYKPFTYLALNLKLYYGLKAEHPAEIYAEVAAKLPWGAREVVTLLQATLSYIGQLQAKLHLKHGYQEECCVWLGQGSPAPAAVLIAQDYAGLSLIKDGLLLPLCQWLEQRLSKSESFALRDVLPFLLKSYLAKRNERWLSKWIQHPRHSLKLTELLVHPLINVLADYSSPNGWSPTYEQAMRRWLGQLQTLMSEHKTACLIEGIPISQQKAHYLSAEIISQLFDAKGEFKGNIHHSAQSKVSQISWPVPGQNKPSTFYFKFKAGNEAGLMGREFAVINLHQLLGGSSHIALGWPLKLTYMTAKGPKVYYCWVSEGISGKSLAEVMQNETAFAAFQTQVDMQSYSHLFVTHYLTCPEDAQPDNFKVMQLSNKHMWILYGLDVGQSFVGTLDEKRKVLNVKSMLYLLTPAIEQPLDAHVLTRLMLLDPQALMQHWQANFKEMNKLFRPLFDAELEKMGIPKAEWSKHNQIIELNEAIKQCVQSRLELLINWLHRSPKQLKSGERLLKALDPAVAFSYQALRGKINTSEDFYKKIDPKAYIRNPNTGKMYSSTTYAQIQQQTLTPERLQASLDLGEEYFVGIDFRSIQNQKDQKYVLALLQAAINNKKPFTYLNLSGCQAISEAELLVLLQKLPALKELHLEDCPQFNLSTLRSLFSIKVNERVTGFFRWDYEVLCPALKTIHLTLEDAVRVFTLSTSLAHRKQILMLMAKSQQQFSHYWNKLLFWLEDKERYTQSAAALQSLGALAPSLSDAQVSVLYNKLLLLLEKTILGTQAAICQSLVKLAPRLSSEQITPVLKKLRFLLQAEDLEVKFAVCKSLVTMVPRLSEAQVGILCAKRLLLLKNEKNWYIQEITSSIFAKLETKLSKAQINQLLEKLLARLMDESSSIQEAAIQSLGELVPRLSAEQVQQIFQKLLLLLHKTQDWNVRKAVAQSLGKLVPKLSAEQMHQVFQKLLLIVENQDWKLQKAARQYFDKLAPLSLSEAKATLQCLGKLGLLKLSETQALIVFEKLLPWLEDSFLRDVANQSLCELTPRLSNQQVHTFVKKLVLQIKKGGLYDEEWIEQQCLVRLASQLSAQQTYALIERMLLGLEEQYDFMQGIILRILYKLVARVADQPMLVEKLLLPQLKNQHWHIQNTVIEILCQLSSKLSNEQVDGVFKRLLPPLGNKAKHSFDLKRLGQLMPKLLEKQVQEVFDKLLILLEEHPTNPQPLIIEILRQLSPDQVIEILRQLSPKLSDKQIHIAFEKIVQLFEKLLPSLKSKSWFGRDLLAIQMLDQLAPRFSEKHAQVVFEKLSILLNDQYTSSVQNPVIEILCRLSPKLSNQQIQVVFEKLLLLLKSKTWFGGQDVSAIQAAIQRLGNLSPRFSAEQVQIIFEKMLLLLKEQVLSLRNTAVEMLCQLSPQLSNEQMHMVFEKLLFLEDQKLNVQLERISVEQICILFAKLLPWLKNKKNGYSIIFLEQLISKLSREQVLTAQVSTLFEQLRPLLQEKNHNTQNIVNNLLDWLIPKLSAQQFSVLVEQLLSLLANQNVHIREKTLTRLSDLVPRLSPEQVEQVIEKLLSRLSDKDSNVQSKVIETLALFYSLKVQLPLLRHTLLNSYAVTSAQLVEITQPIDRIITQKVFSFLDEKTLLTAVPCVSKDWRRWQKVYLQQQAKQQRMQFTLPSEESNNDEDAQETISENNFNRFLP